MHCSKIAKLLQKIIQLNTYVQLLYYHWNKCVQYIVCIVKVGILLFWYYYYALATNCIIYRFLCQTRPFQQYVYVCRGAELVRLSRRGCASPSILGALQRRIELPGNFGKSHFHFLLEHPHLKSASAHPVLYVFTMYKHMNNYGVVFTDVLQGACIMI